jgi:hypothetical protein
MSELQRDQLTSPINFFTLLMVFGEQSTILYISEYRSTRPSSFCISTFTPLVHGAHYRKDVGLIQWNEVNNATRI